MTLEQWPVARLRDYERNPRKNDGAIERMVANLKEFGFRLPVLARSSGEIVDGHLRLKAARKMGIETVPVLLADDMTEAQIKAFRLAVNRSATWADWDFDLLRLELADLRIDGFDLALTGFDIPELASILADPSSTMEIGETTGLAERFGVAPFTVLNAREGWWQDRKRAWLALGIQSEIGRGENLLRMSDTMLEPDPAKRAAKQQAAASA